MIQSNSVVYFSPKQVRRSSSHSYAHTRFVHCNQYCRKVELRVVHAHAIRLVRRRPRPAGLHLSPKVIRVVLVGDASLHVLGHVELQVANVGLERFSLPALNRHREDVA